MAPLERPDLRVVVRILGVLAERQERMRPTRLQQAARTNYTQFSRYLEVLVARDLVRRVDGPNNDSWIELTPKGFEAYWFLYRGVQNMSDSFPGPVGPP